jgi:GntR family transcriptional regulator
MQISLTKASDVALHEQLAGQIVFAIATGQIRQDEQLPSVRALARRIGIHHNTVSKAYQDLVGRGWLRRQRGARLAVGSGENCQLKSADNGLDDIINSAIDRARSAGYSLQALQERVVRRLFDERPDHVLVVEQEPELRSILKSEVFAALHRPTAACSPQELKANRELVVGAQIAAPEYLLHSLQSFLSPSRPGIPLTFSAASEAVATILALPQPSSIGVASVSRILLKTARGVLAPALRRKHTLQQFLIRPGRSKDLRNVDVLFCDTLVLPVLDCRNKVPYRLIASKALDDVAAAFASYD